jgi:hypothetical protein
VERNSIIQGTTPELARGTEENSGEPQPIQSVLQLRSELGISRTQVRNFAYCENLFRETLSILYRI